MTLRGIWIRLSPVEAGVSGALVSGSLSAGSLVFFLRGEEMKRLVLAVAVLSLVACKKAEQANPPADTTMAPAAAPAPADTSKAMRDTSKMMADTSKHAAPAPAPAAAKKKGE